VFNEVTPKFQSTRFFLPAQIQQKPAIRKTIMDFEDDVKVEVLKRSKGRCECSIRGHGHFGQCDQPVTLETGCFRKIIKTHPAMHKLNCHVLCARCDEGLKTFESL
jgi:hypothetical protein